MVVNLHLICTVSSSGVLDTFYLSYLIYHCDCNFFLNESDAKLTDRNPFPPF